MKSEEKDMHSEHKLSLRNGVAASVVTAGLALALGTPVAAFADELQSGSQEGEPVAQTAHDTSAQEATSQSVTSGQEQQGATAKKNRRALWVGHVREGRPRPGDGHLRRHHDGKADCPSLP